MRAAKPGKSWATSLPRHNDMACQVLLWILKSNHRDHNSLIVSFRSTRNFDAYAAPPMPNLDHSVSLYRYHQILYGVNVESPKLSQEQ